MGELNEIWDRTAAAAEIRVGAPDAPSGEEKMLAAATYLLGFVGFWLAGALLIYFWQRHRSRFVAYHAIQSVILQMTVALLVVVAFMATLSAGIIGSAMLGHGSQAEWRGYLVPVLLVLGYGFCLIAPVYCALRGAWVAAHGRLYEAPLFGRLAHKLVDHPGPGAVSATPTPGGPRGQ
jgi:uncharacterized membrane protein